MWWNDGEEEGDKEKREMREFCRVFLWDITLCFFLSSNLFGFHGLYRSWEAEDLEGNDAWVG